MAKLISVLFFITLCILSNAQPIEEARLKTYIIYNLIDYITWPEKNDEYQDFTIGIFGENKDIFDGLTRIAETKKARGKKLVIKQIDEFTKINNLDILFITSEEINYIYTIFPSTVENSILLITETNKRNQKSMINFLSDEVNKKVVFEINKQNLQSAHLSYKETLLLYGGTELDIKELYLSSQKNLATTKDSIQKLEQANAAKQNELLEKSKFINKLESSIEKANSVLRIQNDTINQQNNNIKRQNSLIEEQLVALNTIKNDFKILKSTFQDINDSIVTQQAHLEELNKTIKHREQKIEEQHAAIEMKDAYIVAEKNIRYLTLLVTIMLLIIGAMLLRGYILNKKNNQQLELRVEQRTQELIDTNEKLLLEIQERQKYEKELSISERNYREIFDATTDSIFIHDINTGRIIDVNKSMLDNYGYSRDEMKNIEINQLSEQSDQYSLQKAKERMNEALTNGFTHFEWRARRKDGTHFWSEVTLKSTNIGDKERILAVVHDINEKKLNALELDEYRKNLEGLVKERTDELSSINEELSVTVEELSRVNNDLEIQKSELETTIGKLTTTQQQLIQSEKLASLGVFTAGIAHEINNPVNFISSGASALFQSINSLKNEIEATNPYLLNYFEEIEITKGAIEIGIDRTVAIISSLRNYARNNDTKFINYNVIDCINDALLLLNNSIKYHIQVEKDYPDTIELVCIPGRINQIFVNLISNASQAIEQNGIITISAVENSKDVTFKVCDNGSGISKDNMDKIFDPFFTTKEVGQGTGLGLYIVHGIIEEHAGKISVDSEIGCGTTFTITLPKQMT